ncbi:hypothetical protein MT349_03865 [Rathayibacter caricis]|uniref:hypothetical protein n=1 Tax=Rathayibacter caricis TaxID=110936 RepID=UPI001FB4319E|nr:hypothetical protein [Rathayibacter caricis]MCJ1694907.1 hypothetical protein [Rathayibacter caricis]
MTGPGSVAVLPSIDRREYFDSSFSARSLLTAVALPLSGAVSWWLSPEGHHVETVLVSSSITLLGLGSGWYFIGTGAPGLLLLADTVPRSVSNIAGAVLMIHGAGLLSYALCQLAGAVLTVVLGRALVRRTTTARVLHRFELPRPEVYRHQLAGFSTAAVASVYQALPTLVIATAAPAAVAAYALADRLLKLANSAQAPFSQTLQSWVPAGGQSLLLRRARSATATAVVVGGVAGLGLFVFAPIIGRAVGAGSITLTAEMALPLAVAFTMTIVSQCIGIACLVPLGRSGAVAAAALAGSLTAGAILFAAAGSHGEVGAMWSVAGAEFVVVVIEGALLFRLIRGVRSTDEQR